MSVELVFSHSVLSDSLQPHGLQHARQASLSFTIFQSLLKLMSMELVMPSNLVLCRPLLLLPCSFPSIRAQWSCVVELFILTLFFTCLPMSFKCARYFETNEVILCKGILFFLDSCRFHFLYLHCSFSRRSILSATIN